jgi:hypothetical protein
MNRVILQVPAVCALTAAAAVLAAAEPMRVEAVLAPKEHMRLDFEDGANAYVKWLVRAIFVANPGGKTERRFILQGDMVRAP